MAIPCINRFSQLADGDDCVAGVPEVTTAGVPEDNAAGVPGDKVSRKVNGQSNKDRRLRVATWNYSRLCSERKQKEVSIDQA